MRKGAGEGAMKIRDWKDDETSAEYIQRLEKERDQLQKVAEAALVVLCETRDIGDSPSDASWQRLSKRLKKARALPR